MSIISYAYKPVGFGELQFELYEHDPSSQVASGLKFVAVESIQPYIQ